jgi:ribosomal protein S18 acetylase RimI-like enzyme
MSSNFHQTAPLRSWSSRPYESEHDLRQMQYLLMEGRARTDDWRYFHIGELNWVFFMVDCHLNPQQHIRLWHDGDGKLVGYAILGEDPSFDCQVLPEYEWSGIETEAWAWAEKRISELRQVEAERWSGNFVSGARQDDARRIAFLEQHGFRYCGDFAELNMLRRLDQPVPAAAIPGGCQVRALAETGELAKRAAAQRQVWQPWTVGNVSDEDYARFMRLPGYQRELDIVTVTPQGGFAAYVNGWIDPINRIGDFGPVGALPAYRRQGLTRAALLESLRRMQAYGMERVCISTGVSNTPAIQLYESVGFKIVNKYLDYKRN